VTRLIIAAIFLLLAAASAAYGLYEAARMVTRRRREAQEGCRIAAAVAARKAEQAYIGWLEDEFTAGRYADEPGRTR
jgi:hypothetical protein